MVDDPYLRLVAAVIVKAMLDAHKGEREAWEWLHGARVGVDVVLAKLPA
jgi:hypothetical protein